MFTGLTALSLDTKGRIAIPTRHREKLLASGAATVVLTKHPYDPCLSLYPKLRWEVVMEQVGALSDADEMARRMKRMFIGQAVELETDGSGRILIPPSLRALVELDKTAMLVGQVHRFEIWAEHVWARQQSAFDDMTTLPDSFKNLAF